MRACGSKSGPCTKRAPNCWSASNCASVATRSKITGMCSRLAYASSGLAIESLACVGQIARHLEAEVLITLGQIAEKRAMSDGYARQLDHDTRGIESERDEHRRKMLAVIVLDALEQAFVHAQKKQAVLLRAEEIDCMQRARKAVARDEFPVVFDTFARIERLALVRERERLKAELVAETVGTLGRRPQRLYAVHADIEDRLVAAFEAQALQMRIGEARRRFGAGRQVLAHERMGGSVFEERGNGRRDHGAERGKGAASMVAVPCPAASFR